MLALCFEKAARPLARPGRHPGLAIPPDWWPTWRVVLKPRTTTNQSVLLSPHSNAAFYCGRLLNSQENAGVIPIPPGAHMVESQAPVSSNSSLERGPALPGPVAWLVVRQLPLASPARRSCYHIILSTREHVGPAPRESRPTAGAAGQPARTRHSVRLVADKAHRDQSARKKQQSALRSPHSNAELSGER